VTVAAMITITITADIDATTKERVSNGRLLVSIGWVGGGILIWCNMSSGRGVC
jgi:hypothetical protein